MGKVVAAAVYDRRPLAASRILWSRDLVILSGVRLRRTKSKDPVEL
jgi:hypothetical protein